MTRNMGLMDRCLRLFLVAPVLIGIGVAVGPAATASWVLYAVAGVMVLTSVVGYCPTYRLVGTSTVGLGPRTCGGCRVRVAR